MNVPLPHAVNEQIRLAALADYAILDTAAEQAYDDLTYLAASICGTPVALISLVDETREWFKSRVGLALKQTRREYSFCAHAIANPDALLIIEDASRDQRFADNPLVVGAPAIRFYAGAPLVTRGGEVLGVLCVIDYQPRSLDERAGEALRCLARQVMAQLELRKVRSLLQNAQDKVADLTSRLTLHGEVDALTQLHNRRALQIKLAEEWERAFRYSTPLSLLVLDIDEFRSYNEAYGYAAGDQVLRKVAQLLSRGARLSDMAARSGGDVFALVLPVTDLDSALQIAERIRYGIELEAWPQRPITVSIGVSTYGIQADAASFLAQAEQATVSAKRNGRNCIVSSTL